MKANLSLVVVASKEGQLVYRALRSLYRCRLYAEDQGITVEWIVVLNDADEETTSFVRRSQAKFRIDQIIQTNFNCPGPARTAGTALATAEIVSVSDADDLYSRNWLYKSYLQAKRNHRLICHPEYLVSFGERLFFYRLFDQRDPRIDLRQLLTRHFWSSTITTHHSLFKEVAYPISPPGSGFGHEDWHFNVEAIQHGWQHCLVDQTVRFYRVRFKGSLNYRFNQENALIPASDYFVSPLYTGTLPLNKGDQSAKKGALHRIHHYFIKPWYNRAPLGVRRLLTLFTVLIKKIKKIPLREEEQTFLPAFTSKKQIPEWIINESHILHEIDPLVSLMPLSRIRHNLEEQFLKPDPAVDLYCDLLKLWPDKQFTHILIVPRVNGGGSEHVVKEIIHSLQQNFEAKVLLMVTDQAKEEVTANEIRVAGFLFVKSILDSYQITSHSVAFVRLLLQKKVPVVLVVNSLTGWELIHMYAQQLAEASRLFVLDYQNFNKQTELPDGFGRRYLPQIQPYLSGILTDSDYYRDYLINYLGCPPDLITTLRFPAGYIPTNHQPLFDPHAKSVLWAGRLDKQKRIDLLLEIAQRLPDYKFYVYGRELLGGDTPYIRLLQRQPNIILKGEFTSISDLFDQTYSCFLHTAWFEGTPITLLLIAQLQIPIVATNVGGIGEFIENDAGYLCKVDDLAESYAAQILKITREPAEARLKIDAAYQKVITRHSREHLLAQLKKLSQLTHSNQV